MFFSRTVKTTKVYRKYDKDGKVTEETIQTTEDPKAAEKMSEEMDKELSKMDRFFKKMDEAFKELF